MAFDTPTEFNDLLIYEIFPRAFSNRGFKGIIDELDRLKAIGINAIWLMPIHPVGKVKRKGKLGSPYAIRDYYEIDERLGSKDDFRDVVKRAHELKMKVIMDMVLNHTSPDSTLAIEHPEWFIRDENGNPIPENPEWSDVVDIDYSKREVWDYLINMMIYWVKEFDIDGFRCDVAGLIPIEFWLEARKRVNEIKRVIWISETHDPYMYQAFDITYDYDGYYKLKDFLEGRTDIRGYVSYIRMQDEIYPLNYIKMRFLENHDQDRIANIVRDENTLENLAIFLFTLKGVPLIHNGQEYGIREKVDIFNEYLIPWDEKDERIHELYEKLAHLRGNSKTLKRGKMVFLHNSREDVLISFMRYLPDCGSYILVILPFSKVDEVEVEFSGVLESGRYHGIDILRDEIENFRIDEKGVARFPLDGSALLVSFFTHH